MGYCMNQRDAKFRIVAANKVKALNAIKALASQTDKGGGGSWSGGKCIEKNFSWVTTEEFSGATTLHDAMWAWRWEIDTTDDGDVTSIMFEGEKMGDDTILLDAIAPFVEAGSYIEMQGEDGELWRWAFDGSKLIEQNARISWQ